MSGACLVALGVASFSTAGVSNPLFVATIRALSRGDLEGHSQMDMAAVGLALEFP